MNTSSPTDPTAPAVHRPNLEPTIADLINSAELARLQDDTRARKEALDRIIEAAGAPNEDRRRSAMNALVMLVLRRFVEPSVLSPIADVAMLREVALEFKRRFWRGGNPYPSGMLMLGFAFGIISLAELSSATPDEGLKTAVRDAMTPAAVPT